MKCDMCLEREADRWVLMNDDSEVELCDQCIRALKAEPTIDVDEMDNQ